MRLNRAAPAVVTDLVDDVPIAVSGASAHKLVAGDVVHGVQVAARGTHACVPSGEPFMQMLIIPAQADFELVEMDEEAAEREMRGRRIHASRETLGKETTWMSTTNTVFDGTYRHILGVAKAKAAKVSVMGMAI